MSVNPLRSYGGFVPSNPSPIEEQAPVEEISQDPAVQPEAESAPQIQQVDTFESADGASSEWAQLFGTYAPQPASEPVASEVPPPTRNVSGAGTNRTPEDDQNTVAAAQVEQGRWKGSTPVIKQHKDDNCGAAAVTMLVRAAGGGGEMSDEEIMDDLMSRYGSPGAGGTTPEQMADMLAHEVLLSTRSAAGMDADALNEALQGGHKALALVDSEQIRPGESAETGQAHWVVIDGVNDKGEYLVKDPADGSSYYLSPQELATSMDSGWGTHQGGGMLVVENPNAPLSVEELAAESHRHAPALGNTPGGGSNVRFNTRDG